MLLKSLVLACGIIIGDSGQQLQGAARELFRKEPTSNSILAAVLVPAERLSIDTARAISQEFLGKAAGRAYVQLRIVTEEGQAYPPPKPPRVSYSGWIRQYNRHKLLNWHMAEAIAIGGSAVMKFRDKDGKITRVVLQGQDPTVFTMKSARFELLHLDLLTNPAGNLANVRVYLSSFQPLDHRSGDELTDLLSRVLPFRRASVYVRRDHWFIEEDGFPDFYPFAGGTDPPTEAEYHRSGTMYCGYGWSGNTCRVIGDSQ